MFYPPPTPLRDRATKRDRYFFAASLTLTVVEPEPSEKVEAEWLRPCNTGLNNDYYSSIFHHLDLNLANHK